jgi:hypothetical protein
MIAKKLLVDLCMDLYSIMKIMKKSNEYKKFI